MDMSPKKLTCFHQKAGKLHPENFNDVQYLISNNEDFSFMKKAKEKLLTEIIYEYK